MNKLIKGTHHVAIKYENEEMFEKALHFYGETLGLELMRAWGEGSGRGAMFSTGSSIMELFASGRTTCETGSVNHFALATDRVDECIEAARAEGLEILVEPKEICIPSNPPLPARIGFCRGWGGEEIEFFHEK